MKKIFFFLVFALIVLILSTPWWYQDSESGFHNHSYEDAVLWQRGDIITGQSSIFAGWSEYHGERVQRIALIGALQPDGQYDLIFPEGLAIESGAWLHIVGEFKNILGVKFYLPYQNYRTEEVFNTYLHNSLDHGVFDNNWVIPLFADSEQFDADSTMCRYIANDKPCLFVGQLQRVIVVVSAPHQDLLKSLEIR